MKIKLVIVLCLAFVAAFGVRSAALAADDIAAHASCENCGMDRKAFGYSRMLLRFADGSETGVCSLNCAVIEMDKHPEKTVKALLVADRDSRGLVEASKAVWVMGGDKRGVMTKRPKWAFAEQAIAEKFVKEHGGKLVDWDTVLAAAREDAQLHKGHAGHMEHPGEMHHGENH
ncbi:hypothetical protein GMST_15040 [Geomonas silvestris]|uniref:NosL family protein n=1 Tax=Geomonas silvestris TaxID=2740184 RepID=A0A6V8MHP1_9BACT|nr:nitrous oxide reductase accessory protein NosL [Geomonas silvestris]GFO59179.1 hypothetical protein GMST_15040 [Geomonas silvestris]